MQKVFNLLAVLALVIVAWLAWLQMQPIITNPQPTQPAATAAPQSTPQYIIQAIEPTNAAPIVVTPAIMQDQPNHVRTGITSGTIGSHNPGRTDHRQP